MSFFGRFERSSKVLAVAASALLLFSLGTVDFAPAAHAESDAAEQARLKKFKKKGQAPAISNSGSTTDVGGSKVTTETEIVAAQNITAMLTADSAAAMSAAAERYRTIIAEGGFPKVPRGNYKKGSDGKGVAALNRRLFVEGYLRPEAASGEFAEIFTSATEDAVTRFQRNMGLAATGKVEAQTLAALNVPATDRLRTIQANIPRLQTYGTDLGDRYLVVNVPAQQIETVSNGVVFSRHNAIVGRPERPTPVVMTALSDINFNPYWNTPPSIIERDLIPKMSSGTKILEDMNIKVFQGFGGPEIDPSTVNWRRAIPDDYHFRQEPGPENAMATAKINFSSPFGIYLHDTPEKELFKSGSRFYSSGCVRVEKVDLFMEWILNGQDGIGSTEIAALAETLERRDVKLTTPPQLRVAYLTAWPVGSTVAFRQDVYKLDGTGFTVGQPLPVGEVGPDGLRFTLKPVDRKAAAVEAAEAEGFGLFGRSFRKSGSVKPSGAKKPLLFGNPDRVSTFGDDDDDDAPSVKSKKKTAVASTSTKNDKKSVKNKKDTPGLFDWSSYKKVDDKKNKKLVAKKTVTKKKKLVEKTVAVAEPDTKAKKKAVASVVDSKDKKPVVPVAKKTPEVASDKKKVLDKSCKPDSAGKLPAGCKPPATAAKKPKPVAPVAAVN